MGVGQSERMVSRIERQKAAQVAKSGSSTTTVPSQSIEELHPPKLDDKGHLLPEEVVLRSSNSIVTKEINLGTAEYPVKVEVRRFKTLKIGYPLLGCKLLRIVFLYTVVRTLDSTRILSRRCPQGKSR